MEPSSMYRWDLRAPGRHAHGAEEAPSGEGVGRDRAALRSDRGEAAGHREVTEAEAAGATPVEQDARDATFSAADVSPGPRIPSTLDEARSTILVHAMRGGMDAGSAGSILATHLLENHPTTRVATFDIDELMDYRSRRPTMTFAAPSYTDYEDPVLALDHVATPQGAVLLLHGPEPDLRWEAFSRAVREIVERLGVTTTVGVHGIPMGVPHTRPIGVTAHGTRDGLVDDKVDLFGTVQIPGSASALVEYRLGQWGHDAMGYAVHVPHYLAQTQYPAAAVELLRNVSRVLGEELDTSALEELATTVDGEIEKQIADSPDVGALVTALETQYDAYQEATGRSLLASTEVPSADELGAQFEAFLAEQADQDGDQQRP